jgi:hypothetical protein
MTVQQIHTVSTLQAHGAKKIITFHLTLSQIAEYEVRKMMQNVKKD